MNKAFIEGEKIYLRPLTLEDAEGNYQYWFNDSNLCKLNQHCRFPQYKKSLIEFINSLSTARDQIVLAVIEKETDEHIGNVSLQNINYINHTAEVASIIGEQTPNGFVCTMESIKLMVKHGFDELNLNRIYGGTPTVHTVILKTIELLGFKLEGVSKQAMYKSGKYLDIQNYAILKEDYIKNEIYK